MATKYWLGQADEVAQADTVQITAYDVTTTYKLTVGGVEVSTLGVTDADGTATALAAAWNTSTHPYFTGVTAAAVTDTITLTADVAGVSFVAASSVTGGTGTIGAVTSSVANSGPCDWSVGDNWSDGSVPAAADTVIFRSSAINVCYGLDNNALAIVDLRIEQTYTGKIGLDRTALVTSADGETVDITKEEYREDFLRIDTDNLEIGKHVGTGTAAGSPRIKVSNESTDAAVVTIFNTANVAAESSLAPVRLKTNGTNTDIYIRSGNVGLGIDEPEENCDAGDIFLNGSGSKLFMGAGCSFTNLVQSEGQALVQSDGTVTSIKLLGGTLTTEGDFTITTFDIEAGIYYSNHIKSAGNAITTLNVNGGDIIGNATSEPRTWATVNLNIGGTITLDPNQVTMTALNDPTDEYTLTAS